MSLLKSPFVQFVNAMLDEQPDLFHEQQLEARNESLGNDTLLPNGSDDGNRSTSGVGLASGYSIKKIPI